MRVLGGLLLVHGAIFICVLIGLGTYALLVGNTGGRILGAVLLGGGVVLAVRMARSLEEAP